MVALWMQGLKEVKSEQMSTAKGFFKKRLERDLLLLLLML